jgi:uncharacterized protein YdeI (YjbR/CyaY-like superfamily)
MKTVLLHTRKQWRSWLRDHHDSVAEIWLVFLKEDDAGRQSLTYDDVVEEALCYGWIDSLVKRLDDTRYARKLTPRKPESRWSTINRRRYVDLKARGLLAAPGVARAPTNRSGDAPRPSVTALPPDIDEQLKARPRARAFFETLAPSCRRAYIGWIVSAKREETRQKRLREAIRLLTAGKKLGLK